MKQPCFGYVRVSTVKQGEGASLEAQKEAIERYAAQHSLVISLWFEEKETAAKRGRAVFNDLIKRLTSGAAQGVIIEGNSGCCGAQVIEGASQSDHVEGAVVEGDVIYDSSNQSGIVEGTGSRSHLQN